MVRPWYNKKWLSGSFSVAALVAGFLFVDQGTTGNAVLSNGASSFSPASFVGLLLVALSVVLALHAVRS